MQNPKLNKDIKWAIKHIKKSLNEFRKGKIGCEDAKVHIFGASAIIKAYAEEHKYLTAPQLPESTVVTEDTTAILVS